MDKKEIKIIKECIKELKGANNEQTWIMLKSFMESFIMSIVMFGNNEITKDAYTIWENYIKIQKEETKIHKYIINHAKDIDFNKCMELFDILEETNEQTIMYYIDAFEDIQTACETKNELYAKHSKKQFQTLIETDEYKIKTVALATKKIDIKEFLNLPEEFWNYIKNKIKYIDGNKKENEFFYSTLMKFDENNHLIDIKVLIPYIIDLKTALVNVHELKHVYDLYLLLGKEVNENNPVYEENAIKKEREFEKQYLLRKFGK